MTGGGLKEYSAIKMAVKDKQSNCLTLHIPLSIGPHSNTAWHDHVQAHVDLTEDT